LHYLLSQQVKKSLLVDDDSDSSELVLCTLCS